MSEVETVASSGVVENNFGDASVGIGEELAENKSLAEDLIGIGEDDLEVGEAMAGLETWNVDGDGVMLRNEFEDGFREWGTFGEFDVDHDGGITEDEITEGIFTRYDDDGTGFIEQRELTDMGDEGFWDV